MGDKKYIYHWNIEVQGYIEVESDRESDFDCTYYDAQEKLEKLDLNTLDARIDDDDCWVEEVE